jgi:Beta-lactamase superfamily domain
MTAQTLKLQTLGHATLALYRDGEPPLLLTDPWLVGSVYWRSWWLQHYPDAATLDWLAGAANVYITHEHPDHFHTPSLRRLGQHPTYLFPALAELGFVDYARQQGYRAAVLPVGVWRALDGGVSILSWPLWNDDSLLLIDTPRALILNFNDAKPPPPVVRAVRLLADAVAKPRVLLASYSPASVINGFSDASGPLKLKQPQDYVGFLCRLCERLGADVYLPFASQANFERSDSRWANRHRTGYAELERWWRGPTRLLPPYTTLALDDLTHQSIPPESYRPASPARIAARTAERLAAEQAAVITPADATALRRKLNLWRWLLWPLYPNGFAFEAGRTALVYDPRRGQVRLEPAGDYGDFVIAVPPLTLKEALANDHLTDLGITMFVQIRLLRRVDPRKVYALFVLFQFDDYGHMRRPGALLRWLWSGLRRSVPRRLPSPP